MKKLKIFSLLTITLSLFLLISCANDNEPIDPIVNPIIDPAITVGLPTVTTSASFIDPLTASPKLGGTITSDGGSPITASGIVWNTTTNPTIANSKTNDNTSVGAFISTMTGLTSKTTYYVRTYATNSKGTAYGSEKTITTVDSNTNTIIELPVITTNATFTDPLTSSPKLGGTITSDGGSPIIASGIVWSTTINPTIANSKTNDNTSVGAFISTMTGLSPKTTYYVRAYATNSKGTAYGSEKTLTTVGSNTNTDLALMTANIDNVQYDIMRPFLYAVTGADVKVQNNGAEPSAPRYLWIQGDTTDNLNTLIEINLHVPNTQWAPGTYNLYERQDLSTVAESQGNLLLNTDDTAIITSGTITITEFNLTTRRIKGTFSFTYSKYGKVGQFNVTNGTFNYALDSSYFDPK